MKFNFFIYLFPFRDNVKSLQDDFLQCNIFINKKGKKRKMKRQAIANWTFLEYLILFYFFLSEDNLLCIKKSNSN